jgi:hypothetical protein
LIENCDRKFAMACYDPSQLGFLLKQWGTGNLNNIIDHGHALVGVRDVVMTGAGMTATGLCQRYTQADIDRALTVMLEAHRDAALLLLAQHLLGWTKERLARSLDEDTSSIYSMAIAAEDVFAEILLNHAY